MMENILLELVFCFIFS